MRTLVVASLLLAPLPGLAQQVYKCVGPDGAITFSNNPYCEHRQAYAKDRFEPLLTVKPTAMSSTPADSIIELPRDTADLADVLEAIGQFAGIKLEPVALEGLQLRVTRTAHPWLKLFNDLALQYDLDYRQAYGRIYVYRIGTMGETIVHSPDLLRWYQSDATWNAVLKEDDTLLTMKAYENTELKERLPNLVRRVREALGEKAAVNAAESVTVKENLSAGVGSGIATQLSGAEAESRSRDEKARRISERRQSN